jgi:hypothetical protein
MRNLNEAENPIRALERVRAMQGSSYALAALALAFAATGRRVLGM